MVSVVGAGLAGSAAALAARQHGAEVMLYEKSRFPRHKVCGEYLTPELAPILQSLGVWDRFLAAEPARIHRLVLHFETRVKRCALPEPAFGLSRFALDPLLFQAALDAGAAHSAKTAPETLRPAVLAYGRKQTSTRGGRLFGFKAHFDGPVDDAIELFFFGGFYVGVNAVEGGVTNVCGLGPEEILQARHFEIDSLLETCAGLRDRLGPLRRKWKWMSTGPLVFQNRFRSESSEGQYPAGDALSFVDPFTGSGMLSALTSGRLAGVAAAQQTPVETYLAQCRRLLDKPFRFSSLLRGLLANGWGERLAPFVSGGMLVRLTRPQPTV